ncbi:hypothetical protein MKW92_007957 [Papaver armeniacum]|nr:hypothetical protein MKW92_007957 [Papaver armeniacum]
MDFLYHFQKLCHVETRRSILAVGIVLAIVLVYQSSTLPDGNALFSLFYFGKNSLSIGRNSSLVENSTMVGNNSKSMNTSIVLEGLNNTEVSDESIKNDFEQPIRGNSSVNDTSSENVVVVDNDDTGLGNATTQDNGYIRDKAREPEASLAPTQVNGLDENSSVGSGQRSDSGFTLGNVGAPEVSVLSIPPAVSPTLSLNSMTLPNSSVGSSQRSDSGFTLGNVGAPEVRVYLYHLQYRRHYSEGNLSTSEEKQATPMPFANENSLQSSTSSVTSDINLTKIHQANTKKGWAPQTSLSKISYEMMERTLKIYIYKEGEKPIFHEKTKPILKGIYASEGWFMKFMEDNKHSRMLQLTLYVHDSHKRNNLADYLKKYTPFETRHHMDNCIKVLCNANAARDFKIGKDLTLPEAQIRKVEDPLRDLGGKPSSNRSILAFFAGGMHGYLQNLWRELPRLNNRMNYAQHMKSSKYCICARGYEVNSPQVVEAIFYECVHVIISDNFAPPFFEVLDWEAFAVFVAEDDIPKLKDILLEIPEKKYREMHKRVKKLQQHFLWHSKPVKYDIIHMILHSVWFSRLNQIQV